jgi:hypothetical protein
MNKIFDFLQIYNISLYHMNITEEQRLYIYDYKTKIKEIFDLNLEKKDKFVRRNKIRNINLNSILML